MNDTQESQKVNPKAHYEPRSVEDWQESLRKVTYGGFLIFRDLYRSSAFEELCRHPKHVLVWLEAWSQLNFEGTNNHRAERQAKKQGEKQGKKARVYKNGGIIYLTQHRLEAIGVGVTTQVAAKKALVRLGFLDEVVMPASANDGQFKMSIFRVSKRWQKHPNVPPQEDGIRITRRVYPEHSLSNPNHPIHRQRREANENPIQKVNAKSIQKVNVRGTSAHSITECENDPVHAKPRSESECILKDFHGVQVSSKAEPEHGGAHTAERGDGSHPMNVPARELLHTEHKNTFGSEERGLSKSPVDPAVPKNRIDPQILKKGIPAKIAAFMMGRGHTCTLAEPRPDHEIQLDFSNGSTVHVRPREYELVTNGGAYREKFHDLDELEELVPVSSQAVDEEESPIAREVEPIMFNRGYGPRLTTKLEHGELHLGFAADVHVWIMPGSIKLERPCQRNLTVKNPEMLERRLASENSR